MKNVLVFFLLILSTSIFAQTKDKQTLEVTGAARVNVKPDVGILQIHVTQISPTMGDAIELLGEKTRYHIKTLQRLSFKEEDIKTTSFQVSKNHIYRNEEYIDSGYVASQDIRVEFFHDQKILSMILSEFSRSEKEADFSFSFKLSEELKAKVQDQIIKLAVKDANAKAANMAEAAGIKLLDIQRMVYGGWNRESGMQEVERETSYGAANDMVLEESFNFIPDDLVFRDTVTIYWIVK